MPAREAGHAQPRNGWDGVAKGARVARSVYVTAMEPGSGKSAVVLGLTEVLSRHAARLAFYRPFVRSAAVPDTAIELIRHRYRLPEERAGSTLTADDLHAFDGRADYDELLKRVLNGYAAVAVDADVVVIEGSDFTEASLAVELDLNIDAASHLGSPVLLVVGGRRRSAEQVLDAVHQGLGMLTERGCVLLGVICNRVAADLADAIRAGVAEAAGGIPAAVMPEVPLLAAPTIAEVAARLDAEHLASPGGVGAATPREVTRVIVGAMGLPLFLERFREGDLLITPGDRADLVAGTLAAHLSGSYPRVAGLVLTGGVVDPAVRRLVAGLGNAGVPVLAVGTDTYETVSAVGSVRGAIGPTSERKIATAIRQFEDNVDHDLLRERLEVARPTRTTPLMFEQALLERARADRRHIVLPEGNDDRVLAAAEQLLLRGVADLTVLGRPEDVAARAATLGLGLPGVRVIDPATSEHRERFAEAYAELRKHKGVAPMQAYDVMADASYFGTMMIHQGLADGMVSGAAHTTAHTIRPAFEFIRTAPGVALVSSAFLMCLSDRVLVYADCAVVPRPDAGQLADIAVSAAATASLFGIEPRVAMLSYSTGESGSGSDVDKVREATALVRERRPDLPVEGPIQYDAAIDPDVARTKLPDSAVAGRATVFVFPDLNTGNNTYKAVQRSAGAVAIGPVLQGLAKPVNDLSRGALVADIVNTVAITAIQAQVAR
jgi:phosphate acetyltransferase